MKHHKGRLLGNRNVEYKSYKSKIYSAIFKLPPLKSWTSNLSEYTTGQKFGRMFLIEVTNSPRLNLTNKKITKITVVYWNIL